MSRLIVVGISDLNVVGTPDILITYALGSCVGICLFDCMRQIAGMSHVLLPESAICSGDINIYKFADTAIEELVTVMEQYGCSRFRMVAKIAGGASMFEFTGKSIGERNVEIVKSELNRLEIKIVAEDTGGNHGRTIEFDPENGNLKVRSIAKGNKNI